jgi:capsular exopolysaccharide synthesis family protein
MGRIEKALKQSAGTSSGATKSPDRETSPVPISEDIETATRDIDFSKLPVLVPDEECLETYRIVAAQKDAPQRSVYKVLRTRVLQRMRASQYNVIGITGAGPGEGKTLTAINLAYSLAQDVNYKVILVDFDLRRPSVHEYLGLSPKYDLADVLKGTATLKDVLVCPNVNRLAVMTNQTSCRDSSEILSSPEMADIIQQLKNLGPKTITIVDLPPVLASDDVIAFSPLVDALLLVVGQGRCRREDLQETQELLRDSELLGVVLNGTREKSAATGYYDYY